MTRSLRGRAADPDVIASSRIAREFGLGHRIPEMGACTPGELWRAAKRALPLCDGEYDVLEYAGVLQMHWNVSAEFDATINGSVGEVCRGYWWELLFPFVGCRGHFNERKIAARRFATDRRAELLAVPYVDDLVTHFADVIRRANRGFDDHPNTARMDNVYLSLRMQRWHGRIASATNRIFPCASPFAFRGPLEAALSAHPRLRVRNRMARRLIELLDPRLAALPMAQGYPAVPIRLGTARHFGPLISETLKSCLSKARRASLRSNGNSSGRPSHTLAQLDEVRSLFDPSSMLTRSFYRGDPLGPTPVEPAQFGRVVTLEMLARAVRDCRKATVG